MALLGLRFEPKLKAAWSSKSSGLCVMESGKIQRIAGLSQVFGVQLVKVTLL